MKLKKETHVCPQCDSKNLRKTSNGKEEDVLEENPNDFLCEDCGYYGVCPLAEEEHKEESDDLELHEIEEEKPKKEKKTAKKTSKKSKKG